VLLLCAAALAVFASPAFAKPAHKSVRQSAEPVVVRDSEPGSPRDIWGPGMAAQSPVDKRASRQQSQAALAASTQPAYGGFTTNSLVNEARKYLGTNPTGRATLWCGAFMDLVLRRTGHPPGSNLAGDYARYGTRLSGPEVGAIAITNGGAHVGLVTGVDPNGNPIIVSGNHNRTVAEAVYPRSRVAIYVMP
jgi:uncharacterized protein (TIGR02594 family)